MALKRMLVALGFFLAFFVVGFIYAGTFNCYGGPNGHVNNLTIDMGTVLFADEDHGHKTMMELPENYWHYNSKISKNNLPTPKGNFEVRVTVKLAGTVSIFGLQWIAVRNVVTVEVHQDTETGPILQQTTLDKKVRYAEYFTLTTPQVIANLKPGKSLHYAIVIRFNKYDSDDSDDGFCVTEINVRAEINPNPAL